MVGAGESAEGVGSGKRPREEGQPEEEGQEGDAGSSASKVARVGDEAGLSAGVGAKAGQGASGAGAGNRRLCTFYLKGRCDKGDECTFSHDVERKHCRCVQREVRDEDLVVLAISLMSGWWFGSPILKGTLVARRKAVFIAATNQAVEKSAGSILCCRGCLWLLWCSCRC